MEFTREVEEEESVKTLKHNKRILFQRMATYPQRKVITFNRYNDDFVFNINYGDLSFLSQEDLRLELFEKYYEMRFILTVYGKTR